jgi:hypothetical protein
MTRRFSLLLLILAVGISARSPCAGAQMPEERVIEGSLKRAESAWARAQRREPMLGCRELFSAALAYCEGRQCMERVAPLLGFAAQMQDRNPVSATYGNFRWYWGQEEILDRNAVDFCMQTAALLWLRHREILSEPAKKELRELMGFSMEGLLRHRVDPTYTNIALMNAGDLILLGESLGRPDVAEAGYRRLEIFLNVVWEQGVHEYVSPTYYGVNLDGLLLVEALAQKPEAREQARGLLEFFWTDLALNFYPPSQRLGGARSRDYDYLHGLGVLDEHLFYHGWLPLKPTDALSNLCLLMSSWKPGPDLLRFSESRFPRRVEQSWGSAQAQSRTHYVCADVTLSSAGAGYGGKMDLPLTVDLPGTRALPRCYFIPDARHDPYGKKRIAERSGHQKSLHLQPFWTAAQRERDAMGLAIYKEGVVPPDAASLESHFVLPREVDTLWIGQESVDLGKLGKSGPWKREVPPGTALVFSKGTAAVGIRVPWSRGRDGGNAPVFLVGDANPHGVLRVTVDHGVQSGAETAGAAFWVRIGSQLDGPAALAEWRTTFATAAVSVEASARSVLVRAEGSAGSVATGAAAPYDVPLLTEPAWNRAILAVDGQDLGRQILARIPLLEQRNQQFGECPPVLVDGSVRFEAESGSPVASMVEQSDTAASGARYVGVPGKGERDPVAKIRWPLEVAQTGDYYLWGRVRTASESGDSFFVDWRGPDQMDGKDWGDTRVWNLGVHPEWTWVRLDPRPGPVRLSKGRGELVVRGREPGAMLDAVALMRTPEEIPQ